MARIMSDAMALALMQPVLRMAIFVSMQFGDNTKNYWSGLGPMTWNSMTFDGTGTLGSIGTTSEDSTVEAKNLTLSLSGIPADLLTEVEMEVRVLGVVAVWFALYDSTYTLIPSPVLAYQGRMDQPTLEDSGTTCSVSITVENILVDLNRACYRRFTADDLQLGLQATLARLGLPSTTIDTGFRFVPGVQESTIYWGSNPSSVNTNS